ncbi:hypothetical protein PoB_001280300 [Plakobranchus ocellatus]|uniref:Uncharacterized protein n=1 Tax=Plakobranchus ocellatus TaxID=259542 RepID=A0AAV3YUR2_9GAST|nr:hypothetical protein PoB_001280300 [Plakobranchus ocellatus]
MSRAAPAKTRGADKTKPPASQTPVITHEIVPGKFTDHDWNFMVDRDGADEFITDIVDELMETTMSAIYDKYIESQLLPFTITQARDAITEIIEWQFLARDEGELEMETDLGWAQDEEPEPAVTDCWAQGSVPRNLIPIPEVPLEEIPEEPKAEEEAIAEVPQEEETTAEPPELEDTVSESEAIQKEEEVPKVTKEMSGDGGKKESSSDSTQKPRAKFRPYKGKLKSAGVRKMTESLEETEMKMMYDEIAASKTDIQEMPNTLLNMPASCSSILKVQTGRPPGNKEVVYDDFGNVVAVMKLDPEKLPTHKVNVKYHVVDPAVEAAQARLDAMRKGKSTGSKVKKVRSMKLVASETPLSTGTSTAKAKAMASASKMAPLPPPLIEEMEVSHGVIIREGGRVKKGPGRYYRKLDILEESQKGMAPVTLRISNPGITVADLLDRHTPILRPLSEASPLPPIVPQPPPQQTQKAA